MEEVLLNTDVRNIIQEEIRDSGAAVVNLDRTMWAKELKHKGMSLGH